MNTASRISQKTTIATLFIFFIVGIGLYAAPTELITAYGDEFSSGGFAFRFIGVNIRGICHYGYGNPLPYTLSSHIDENLDGVVAMGGKVIRLFAAVNNATHQQVADRLENVLDKMETRGLKAIVCLTDVYNTPFHPNGDDGYYQLQPGGWTLLDDTWFSSGYTINYLPWVELAVNQLKDHNAIFAWELGNELTDIKNPNNIIAFTKNVAAAIKSIDPYHMVSTGFLSIDHTQIGEVNGVNLYSDPNIDFITEHSYNGDDFVVNHGVHSKVGKPLVLDEYGWASSAGNRVTNTEAQVEKWFTQRESRGFMNWGYQAQSYDIGDGDNIFGVDRYAHSDYNEMVGIYSAKAAEIAANPVLLPTRLEPVGTNIAGESTAWQTDSVYGSNWGGEKAIDGVISDGSKWTSDGSAPPHWLALDLGTERLLDGFTVWMSGATGELFSYSFKDYAIQSGSSLSGPWTTEFTDHNPAQFSVRHSIFDIPKLVRFVRIYITDTGIDNYARLPEFEVYETDTAASQTWVYY